MVSNGKWQALANILFRTWEPAEGDKEGGYKTKKFDGVGMPVPKQRYVYYFDVVALTCVVFSLGGALTRYDLLLGIVNQ